MGSDVARLLSAQDVRIRGAASVWGECAGSSGRRLAVVAPWCTLGILPCSLAPQSKSRSNDGPFEPFCTVVTEREMGRPMNKKSPPSGTRRAWFDT